MKLFKTLSFALAGILAAGSAYAACDPGETVIKFSHVTNTDKHPKGIAASLLAERVNEDMNGIMCMEVFPNSSLYDDNKVLEALLNGDVQLAAPSLSKFEKFTKQFRIFDLPFMFTDINAVDYFQNSFEGQELMDSMRHRGLQGLAFWHNGMKQMSASRPLIKPEDAKGLKFRVQPSDVLVAQFEQLDANPQKMSFKEVYGGLQTKVIDGQENTWSNIFGKKFFEVQDGVTETNHGIIDYLVVASTDFLDSLSLSEKETFTEILAEVTSIRNEAAATVNQENRQAIIDAGGTVRSLSADERDAWVDALKPVWTQFENDVPARFVEAAQAANEAASN